jgi:heme o synthase
MKVSITTTIPEQAIAEKSMASVISELVKARLTALVVLTTLVGFYAGSHAPIDYWVMLHTVLGTALVACGAAALNQLLERDLDAKMERTADRPLPSGRMQPDAVLIIGGGLSIAGLVYLAMGVNFLTALLGALTLISYIFIYTPLKKVTTLNTAIGAIPGAIPPLMGWTAARGEVSVDGWSLFAILFFWQLPHFLAIAWIYKEDYARAGFAMLPVVDTDGKRTGSQAVSHTLGLLPVSLCPAVFGLAGPIYFVGAFVLGITFCYYAVQFSRYLTVQRARQLFFASILYLPLLLGLLVFDKIK